MNAAFAGHVQIVQLFTGFLFTVLVQFETLRVWETLRVLAVAPDVASHGRAVVGGGPGVVRHRVGRGRARIRRKAAAVVSCRELQDEQTRISLV